MIDVNNIKNGMTIKYEGNIFSILEFQHVKPGKGPAFVRTKIKNLRTGAIIDKTFNTNVKFEKAHIVKQGMQYLYQEGNMLVFMNTETYEQKEIAEDIIEYEKNFIKEGDSIDVSFYEGEIIGISLPDKVELEVVKTEPAVKGNTSQTAMKEAELETGYTVMVPLFINEGEIIVVSTDTGKYTGRK